MENHGKIVIYMEHHHFLLSTVNQLLVGGLEPWNFMTFHILGIMIPTDVLHDFSEG